MVKALFGALIVFILIIVILLCVCFWLYNYATLEKLGYADVEIGEIELPNGEMQSVTARDLGIENMTVKQLLEWFKDKVKSSKAASN